MLPPRTGRRSLRRSAAFAAPYCRKPKHRGIKKGRKVGGSPTASLSDDALANILARLPDAASVVRCAATCRRWGRVVATSAAIVSRSLPPIGRFLPDLAVGLFHKETDLPAAASPLLPCFVPMASAARFLGAGQQRLLGVAGLGGGDRGILDHSRPVASRNGRLVMELKHEVHGADGLWLAVCNPMMHDNSIVIVPPLISEAGTTIQDYGCALLTGQDLRPPRCNTFFRLLLVYNRGPAGNSTVLRCYSSDAGCWGREAECSVQVPSSEIRDIGQAVVRRGVAFWALDLGVLGARLDEIDQHGAVTDMHLMPYPTPHTMPQKRLLGISPDNRLFFMDMGVVGWKNKFLLANLCYFKFSDEDNIRTGRMLFGPDREDQQVRMPNMKLSHYNTSVKLRWFGEKSGLVLFTMGRPSGHRGTFVLNLRDKVFNKVADDGDSWKNLLGYEMDMAAYLVSSVNPQSLVEKPAMPSIWRFAVCRTTGTRYITLEHR
uniref:Uncharacterized protein n=1 Tax=Avena sativa TaxID=4498 RepID=A0ACD5XDP8_AVESA